MEGVIPTRYYIVEASNPKEAKYLPYGYHKYEQAKHDLNKLGCENFLILKGFDIIWKKLEPYSIPNLDLDKELYLEEEKELNLNRLKIPFKPLPSDTKERIGYWAKVKRKVRKTLKNL